MTTVYACFDCYHNGCDVFETLVRIVDSEEKAIAWKDSLMTGDPDRWREFEECEVQ